MVVLKARIIVVTTVFALVFGLVVARLFDVQVLNGRKYAAESRRQTHQRVVIPARRGTIRDRNGDVLASSVSAAGQSSRRGRNGGSGDSARPGIARVYPHGGLAGSVLGYVGVDGYGLGGVEYAFDTLLRGQNGWSILQKDGINNRYARIDRPQEPPVDGCDVYLTLDVKIQKIVENVLSKTVARYRAQGGACIVMDPVTGDILAMASEPGFDPNRPAEYPIRQRGNRCIGYNYEPGSTFKVITAASVLEEGLKSEGDTIDGDQGVYEIYDQSIRDHKPFGRLSFREALAYSSNVCFAKIADELGKDRLFRYTKDFGLGAKTGIELPGEENGIMHPLEKWSGRTHVTMAIGQEVSVTLLQMALVFCAVANDGVLIGPRIISRIEGRSAGRGLSRDARRVRRVVSRSTARRLRTMLEAVVQEGTGTAARIPGASVAGKTGTSQKIDEESGEYSQDRVWSSFIGFAPSDKPALLCAVAIDEPAAGEGGGVAAAPAFRATLGQIISQPGLEFAELIIEGSREDSADTGVVPRRLPDVCGMETGRAAAFLRGESIAFEIVGTGETIRHQSPAPGKVFGADGCLILYADNPGEPAVVRMPSCIGKDLRDAVNAVNIKGLQPYVRGAGAVRRQHPTAGVALKPCSVCTLYCSFDG
ncbi:MAG: hypothetical protein GF418_04265 [Chitinivibrionales bacterium]|nr:hypothetical protein [Chitinivibrionales bacterium]MBD3394822.1 hypothetical protein [Chitinivibrionales bacterium]